MNGPLDGIRVIDCSAYITGPIATMLLADQGADVVKVEAPGLGDVMRYIGTTRGGMSTLWAGCNRGKRSLALNLQQEEGRRVLERLVAGADVFVQNFRPGVVERLGIDEKALRGVREDLIYVSISAFGPTGPWAQKPAFDHVVQAASGIAAVQADAETGEPRFVRNAMVDKITGYTAAQAISAALYARGRSGTGQHLQLSMLDTAISFLWPDGMANHALLGDDVQLMPPVADSYRMIELSDGLMATAVITEAQLHGLFRALDRPELSEDPRFSTASALLANLDALREELGEAARQRTVRDSVARLEAEDVPCSPVLAVAEVADHPQVVANETLETTEHPQMGTLRRPRPPVRFSRTAAKSACHAPALGEHTDSILNDLGFAVEEVERLRQNQVVG